MTKQLLGDVWCPGHSTPLSKRKYSAGWEVSEQFVSETVLPWTGGREGLAFSHLLVPIGPSLSHGKLTSQCFRLLALWWPLWCQLHDLKCIFFFYLILKTGRGRNSRYVTGRTSYTVAAKGSASRCLAPGGGIARDWSEWNQSATEEKQGNESPR